MQQPRAERRAAGPGGAENPSMNLASCTMTHPVAPWSALRSASFLLLGILGSCTQSPSDGPTPSGTSGWSQIAGACGVSPAGALCWGWDAAGKSLPPSPVTLDRDFVYIAGLRWQGCGLTAAGEVFCWGETFVGSRNIPPPSDCLGIGPQACSVAAIPILPAEQFTRLAVGTGRACATTRSGALACWGEGSDRVAPGPGETPPACVPADPQRCIEIDRFSDRRYGAVAAGEAHACALDAAGSAYCSGMGSLGELGFRPTEQCPYQAATMSCATSFLPVQGGLRFVALTTGRSHTCGLDARGAAFCWGSNSMGQLGTEAALEGCGAGHIITPCSHTPRPVAGGLTFRGISAHADHTCAITASGETWCWGDGSSGQLGQGIIERSWPHGMRPTPVKVLGDQRFVEVTAGGPCGRTAAGELYCWGIRSPDRDVAAPIRMPDPPGRTRLLSFAPRDLPERPGIQASISFAGDTMVLQGIAELRCGNSGLHPAFAQKADTLELWLVARRWEGGGCEDSDQLVGFDARVGPIAPGSYKLNMIHLYADDADRMRPGGLGPMDIDFPPSGSPMRGPGGSR